MGRGGWRFGAGRPGWRLKAEHCLRLDVRDLARRRLLVQGGFGWRWTRGDTGEERGSIGVWVNEGSVRLDYSSNGRPTVQDVTLERTRCQFGGSRPWFRCPRCNKRVAVLFFRGGLFRCRLCSAVAYSSQSEDACARSWRRQAKFEAKLDEDWARPKHMRRQTHERILDAIRDCEEARDLALAGVLARLGFPGLS